MNGVARVRMKRRVEEYGGAVWKLALGFALVSVGCCAARADIGVVLADPTTIGVSEYTHAGHSLVYLTGVCAETPVKARLCAPGEQGSIVTMYPDMYENQDYSWNIVPVSLFIDGFSEPGKRLLYSSENVKAALQLHARVDFMAPVCGLDHCPQVPHAYWRDAVGATIDRDVFIFAAKTTRPQDEEVMRWLNSHPNVNEYNSFTNNCSNFTEALINTIYPHAIHRDFLNDLLMMSPKAAAHTFTRYGTAHPDLGLYSLHFAQSPGALPRAGLARSGTEDAIHMKKYLIPAALIGDHEVAGSFFVAYYFTGRFGLYKEYSLNAAPGAGALHAEAAAARRHGNEPEAIALEAGAQTERETVLGSPGQWQAYREQFRRLCEAPDLHDLLPRPGTGHGQPFPAWYAEAKVWTDAAGEPWMTQPDGEGREVGLSTANLVAPESEPRLAVQLMLAKVSYALEAKNHYRETMPLFEQDWKLMQAAVSRLRAAPSFSLAERREGADAAPAVAGQAVSP